MDCPLQVFNEFPCIWTLQFIHGPYNLCMDPTIYIWKLLCRKMPENLEGTRRMSIALDTFSYVTVGVLLFRWYIYTYIYIIYIPFWFTDRNLTSQEICKRFIFSCILLCINNGRFCHIGHGYFSDTEANIAQFQFVTQPWWTGVIRSCKSTVNCE